MIECYHFCEGQFHCAIGWHHRFREPNANARYFPHFDGKYDPFVKVLRLCNPALMRLVAWNGINPAEVMSFHSMQGRPMMMKYREERGAIFLSYGRLALHGRMA